MKKINPTVTNPLIIFNFNLRDFLRDNIFFMRGGTGVKVDFIAITLLYFTTKGYIMKNYE